MFSNFFYFQTDDFWKIKITRENLDLNGISLVANFFFVFDSVSSCGFKGKNQIFIIIQIIVVTADNSLYEI